MGHHHNPSALLTVFTFLAVTHAAFRKYINKSCLYFFYMYIYKTTLFFGIYIFSSFSERVFHSFSIKTLSLIISFCGKINFDCIFFFLNLTIFKSFICFYKPPYVVRTTQNYHFFDVAPYYKLFKIDLHTF